MKCPVCHRMFEPSDEEWKHTREVNGPDVGSRHTYFEIGLPKFCSWACYKHFAGLRFHGNKAKENEAKKKNRWIYHIGELGPRPGTTEARIEEEKFREEMQQMLEEYPPRFIQEGFSNHVSTVCMTLPSQFFFGKPNTRILDDSAVHLGGEDGETFNFPDE